MKKRLSLLMALVMVITLLPMSAFAAANVVVTAAELNVSAEKAEKELRSTAFTLKFPDGTIINNGKFRLELDNGAEFFSKEKTKLVPSGLLQEANLEWNVEGNLLFVTIKDLNADPAQRVANSTAIVVNAELYLPNTGDVNVKVVDESNTGVGTLAATKIAVVKEESTELSATVKDASKVISFDGGKLSQFEIKNFNFKETDGDTKELVISVNTEGVVFLGKVKEEENTKVLVDGQSKEGKVVDGKIVLAKADLVGAKSVIVIPVFDKTSRKATEGDVVVYAVVQETVDGKTKNISNVSATVGKLVNYSVTMEVVEKGKKAIPEVWGGETAKVRVTLKGPKGSFTGRAIDFKVEGAEVKPGELKAGLSALGKYVDEKGKEKDRVYYKDGEFYYSNDDLANLEKVEFDLEIKTDADKDGVATIVAAQRGWEQKADLAKVTPKFKVEASVNQVKKGEMKETSDIVIKEAKAGLLAKGDKFSVAFKTRRDYTEFAAKPKFEATNGLKFDLDKIEYDATRTVVTYVVTRSSAKEPAVVTLSGVKVRIDGSATDAEVKVYGQLNGADVSSAKYIAVVKEYALGANKSMFTVGQTTYKVDEKEMTLLVAPYIKEGRVMLPIRAIAEALGLKVQWNAGTKTATFTDATKTAAVVIGADMMYVNGTPIKLNAKAELKGGVTFVELRSLALAFGVDIAWDGATKTATVSR